MSAGVAAPGPDERLPTLRGRTLDEIERITDVVFSTVGRPLKSASLFYALYWLVEIEGVTEAAFAFKRERERQSIGFWWYGTFSMASEFSNASSRYFIVGEPISNILNLDRVDLSITEHAREFLFPDDDVMGPAAEELLLRVQDLRQFTVQRDLAGYTNTYIQLRNQLEGDRFRDLGPWNEIARDLFQVMPATNKGPDLIVSNEETGWGLNFNGPAWVGIGNHLLRRDDLSDTAWVDQSWAVQHNNRAWFDKIDFGIGFEGPDEAAVRAIKPNVQRVRARDVGDAALALLDANLEGDMETVFEAAVEYDQKVEGINLRRLARQAGVLEF